MMDKTKYRKALKNGGMVKVVVGAGGGGGWLC